MAYTLEQAIDDVLLWGQRLVVNKSIGRQEVLLLIRESFQRQYNLARAADIEYFIRVSAFGPATSVNYPTSFDQVVIVEVPTARSGAAVGLDLSEWYRRVQNTRNGPTADYPIYKLNATAFDILPSSSGNLYYVRTFGDTDLENEATDLEAILPRPFHQGLVLDTVMLTKKRHFKDPNPIAEKKLEEARDSHSKTMKMLYPKVQALFEQPVPGNIAKQIQ